MYCEECGSICYNGTCPNCGLTSDEWQDITDEIVYHEDEDEELQHGAPRTHRIPNMAVMTWSNPNETENPNLRRALRKDGWFGWDVQSSMFINNELKRMSEKFKLGYLFVDDCYYYMRKYKDKINFTGKSLEDVIPALLYLFVRLNGQPLTLLDLKKAGYDEKKVYNIYIELISKLNLYKKIRPQNPAIFVEKAIDYIFDFNQFYWNAGRYATRQQLINFVKKQFLGIYRRKTTHGFIDLSTNGLSTIGAILYVSVRNARDFRLTQSEIANACNISEVTLRKYIKKLKDYYRAIDKSSKNGII